MIFKKKNNFRLYIEYINLIFFYDYMYSREQVEATIRLLQKENSELKNQIDHLQRIVSELFIELKKIK